MPMSIFSQSEHTMANDDSQDFLHEIDELLSETTENGSVQVNKQDESLTESIQNFTVTEKDKMSIETNLEASSLPMSPQGERIRESIDKNEGIEVLQQLCSNGVPDELRGEVWRSALGVRKRPDAIGTWEGPLDYENQTLIHKQCQQQAGICPYTKSNSQSVTTTIEQVITFYCKSRNIAYKEDNGMAELLGPLAAMGLSKGDLFNCLYVLLSKYIPKDCRPGGKPFDLFRLLLLYHDPELCSILDTRKLKPDLYLQPWLRSLFANHCSIPVLYSLWDQYFLNRDPFLMFFLALVMVINAKELILETPSTTPVEEIVSMIKSLPQQLTVEDIPDFVSLAQYYATRTPHSFRKDYHNFLFGNSRSINTVNSGILCLPVHFQEIFDSISDDSQQGLKYFMIDCRPLAHFSVGHLPDAIHLDTDLLLHSPQDFAVAMERLNDKIRQAKTDNGEHLCFFGSGREHEDQYMHMVVAKFLQQSSPYVSMARGGFIEMWRILGGRADKVLEDFDLEKCKHLYEDYPAPMVVSSSSDNGSTHSDGSDSEGFSSQYRQRFQQKSSQLYTSLSLGWRDRSQRMRVKFGEMWQSRQAAAYKDNPVTTLSDNTKTSGRRYRNRPDVFVVADDDDNEDTETSTTSSTLVNISLYSTSPEIAYSFPCSEVTSSNDTILSHLLLTATEMIVLREAPDRPSWGRVKHREKLVNILKITAKKKDMNVIIFRFGEVEDNEAVVNKVIKLKILQSRKATDAIQELLGKMDS